MADFFLNDFYCMNCGHKIMALPRSKNHKRAKYHRKRMYCPWCKQEANSIECRNDEEVYEFKEAFNNGEFISELTQTLEYTKSERNLIWS